MEVKEVFKKHCQRINFIYILAKQNFHYCYYMHKPETQEELEYTQIDRHLKSIRHSLWRITILELAKLYSKSNNDKFNLNKFIKNLRPAGIFSEMAVSETVIQGWEASILSEEPLIKNILILRNKLYAHTDEELGEEAANMDIFFTDIERLLDFTENLMKKIYHDVLDSTLTLKPPNLRGRKIDWIKILADDHKKGLKKYYKPEELTPE